MTLWNNLQIEEHVLDRNYSQLSGILLFGDSSFKDAKNTNILNATIQYIFDTKRSGVPLINLLKLQKWKKPIYYVVCSMNRGDLILIKLLLVSLYINFHFV